MANSKCSKCEGLAFERSRIVPIGEQRAVSVLQCAQCGTVIGVLDNQQAIEALHQEVASINAGLLRIVKAMQEES